ncbi:MAG: hypothetical protein ACI9ZT_001613 [Gammaproteobacteria bacterium]|jgi:hypothetical protein
MAMTEFNLPMGTELFINHSEDDGENFSCSTLIGFLYAQNFGSHM